MGKFDFSHDLSGWLEIVILFRQPTVNRRKRLALPMEIP